MAFVISKYLVHGMFFRRSGWRECCLGLKILSHASCERISNMKFMLLSVQKFMLMSTANMVWSSFLPHNNNEEEKDKHVVSGLWFIVKPNKSDFMKLIHLNFFHLPFFHSTSSWEVRERMGRSLQGIVHFKYIFGGRRKAGLDVHRSVFEAAKIEWMGVEYVHSNRNEATTWEKAITDVKALLCGEEKLVECVLTYHHMIREKEGK